MSRPNIKDVKKWELEYSNSAAQVFVADMDEKGFFYKVEALGRTRYFYGETAWSDAYRFANDAQWFGQF